MENKFSINQEMSQEERNQAIKEELERQANEKRRKNETEISDEQVKQSGKEKVKKVEEAASGMADEDPQVEAENANKSVNLSPEKVEGISKKGFKNKIIEHSKKVLNVLNEFRKKVENLSEDFMEGGGRLKGLEEEESGEEKSVSVEEKSDKKGEGEKTKVCPNCGAEELISSSFCGKCGTELRFNPEKELKSIRSGTKEERRQKLANFKEKLVEQKKILTEVQKRLFEEIEKNPDATAEEYLKSIEKLSEGYLSALQKESIKNGLDSYIRRHQAIKENTRDCIDPETGKIDGPKLYEKLFNKKPIGRVEVLLRPAIIYLRIENLDDYTVSFNHGAIEQVTDKERKRSNESGGCKLGNFHIKGLENAITLEKATDGNFDKMSPYAKVTLEHEEQHSINAILRNAYDAEEVKRSKNTQKRVDRINKGAKAGELDQIITESQEDFRNIEIEKSIKDEISAYFRDGRSSKDTRNILLSPKTIYEYGFDYKGGSREKSEFSQKYIDLVENGIIAFDDLLKSGYTAKDAQSLLFVESLSNWPKVVERLTGRKKNADEIESDKMNLSPISLEKKFKKLESTPEKYKARLSEIIKKIKDEVELSDILGAIEGIRLDFNTGEGMFANAIFERMMGYVYGNGDDKELNRIPDVYGFREKARELRLQRLKEERGGEI